MCASCFVCILCLVARKIMSGMAARKGDIMDCYLAFGWARVAADLWTRVDLTSLDLSRAGFQALDCLMQ